MVSSTMGAGDGSAKVDQESWLIWRERGQTTSLEIAVAHIDTVNAGDAGSQSEDVGQWLDAQERMAEWEH